MFENGVVQLSDIDPIHFKLLVNGHRLKIYHKLSSREEFLDQFQPTIDPTVPATIADESSTHLSSSLYARFTYHNKLLSQ